MAGVVPEVKAMTACRSSLLSVMLLLLPSLAVSQQGYRPLPKLVVHARYVLVTTYEGYDLTSPKILPDDRRAVLDVQNAITKWGRYALAYRPEDADLILLVRKGRIVAAQPQMRVEVGSNRPTQLGADAPVDIGDSRDMLAMYDSAVGIDSAALWRDSVSGGLDAPNVELVQELRKAVDQAAKVP